MFSIYQFSIVRHIESFPKYIVFMIWKVENI